LAPIFEVQLRLRRSVAQPGSAPGLGPGGPRFESLYSDQYEFQGSPVRFTGLPFSLVATIVDVQEHAIKFANSQLKCGVQTGVFGVFTGGTTYLKTMQARKLGNICSKKAKRLLSTRVFK
jgi:hypothetical protein